MRFLMVFSLCSLFLLAGCAATPGTSASNTPAPEKSGDAPHIVFSAMPQDASNRNAILSLLSNTNAAGLPIAGRAGGMALESAYVSAAGTPCALMVSADDPLHDNALLACRHTSGAWVVRPALQSPDVTDKTAAR